MSKFTSDQLEGKMPENNTPLDFYWILVNHCAKSNEDKEKYNSTHTDITSTHRIIQAIERYLLSHNKKHDSMKADLIDDGNLVYL
jgi:hypothetical protein